jgi:hypothetical protein
MEYRWLMITINEWLRSFLDRRGRTVPDGRPLYAYRCETPEFRELQDLLGQALAEVERTGARIGPLASQAFCLWAAEWWRRNHEGGHWRWEDLLTELGHDWLAPGSAGYSQLCTSVGTGLTQWRRPLLRTAHGRAFLVTLACEGGLPLRLVLREQASLRRYFKALLEEIRVFGTDGVPAHELAERSATLLPKSLRQEVVYSLCGQLVTRIWQLQEEVGGSETPVSDLDQRRPGWRDELPLRVSDKVARALLTNLLADATEIARRVSGRIRWARSLVGVGNEGWDLEGALELPRSLPGHDYTALFALPGGDVPGRFDLCLRSSVAGADEVVALGTLTRGTDGTEVLRLEASRAAGRRVYGEAAAASRVLIARSGSAQHQGDAFSGSAALSELPWTFEPAAGTETGEPARLVGEGSVSARARSVLVAVPPGTALLADEKSHAELVGPLRGLGREVFRLAGRAVCHLADGSKTEIRTGDTPAEGAIEYRLRGARLEIGRSGEAIFTGAPRLFEQREGQSPAQVPDWKLEWRGEEGESGWRRLSASCFGRGRIRYVEGDRLRFSARITLLPAGAAVRYSPGHDPRQGTIELAGFDARNVTDVAVVDAPGVALRRLPDREDTLRIELSTPASPPTRIALLVRWTGGQRAMLSLPFPGAGSGFERPDGRRLAPGALVSASMLSGMRAVAMVPRQGASFTLEARYRGEDAEALGAHRRWLRVAIPEVAPGRFELDLGAIQSCVVARLDSSTDEDGQVRLEVHSNDAPLGAVHTLLVARHDLTLMVSDEAGVVRLPAESMARLDPAEVEIFRLEAIPLYSPDQPPTPLDRYSNVTWSLPEEDGATRGPWLLVGWQGDWCRAQPARWDRPIEAEGMQRVRIPELAADTDHPAWRTIDDLIDWTEHLPPVSLGPLRALITEPQAMALAALRVSDARFDRFWAAMETLPFAWRLLPRTAWEAAVKVFIDSVRRVFDGLGEEIRRTLDTEALLREQLDRGIGRVVQRLRALQPVLGQARARALGLSLTVHETAIQRPEIRAMQLTERNQLLASSGAATGDLRGVQVIDGIEALCRRLPMGTELDPLWYRRPGLDVQHPRFSVANGPVIAAFAALAGVPITQLQLCQLRGIREVNPHWFDDTYDACYLYALGTL